MKFSEASERNKDPILNVLRGCLTDGSQVLEIGSGSGQHAVYFAANLPGVTWLPTERTEEFAALAERIQAEGGSNLCAAVPLDVSQHPWPVGSTDAIFSANTFHIMSWQAVLTLLQTAGRVIRPDGLLIVYGPFQYGGQHTADSNRQFDGMLRRRDPASGIRDAQVLQQAASDAGLVLEADHAMPANNRLLVFRRQVV
jgi:cyclopropane fatty-acyl-phospholipid synthase-like methyltransferase